MTEELPPVEAPIPTEVPPVDEPTGVENPPVDLVAVARAAVERATALPRGIRAEIDRLLSADRLTLDPQGRTCLPLDDALAAFAASLPRQFGFDPSSLPPVAHPGGEAFFTGDPHELTDERAEAIARAQLERAGWSTPAV